MQTYYSLYLLMDVLNLPKNNEQPDSLRLKRLLIPVEFQHGFINLQKTLNQVLP